jgi:hypothetical protein
MRRTIALCLSTALALVPVPAMASQVLTPPGSASPTPAPANCTSTPATVALVSAQSLSAPTTANTKTTGVLLGTTASAYSGFTLTFQNSISNAGSFIDIATDSGFTNIIVKNWYAFADQPLRRWFPVAVGNSATVYIRYQSTVNTNVPIVSLTGDIAATGCFAGFTAAEAVFPDLTATKAGTQQVPIQTSSPTWTDLGNGSTTSRAYSAVIVNAGIGTSSPGTTQPMTATVGWGTAGSETTIGTIQTKNYNSSTGVLGGNGMMFKAAIPSGSRITGQAFAAANNAGAENVRIQVMGIY